MELFGLTATAAPHVHNPLGQGLVIFDLDRTLVPGSSLVPLARQLVHDDILSRWVVARHLVTATAFRRRGLGENRLGRLRDELLSILEGYEVAPLAAVARDVGSTLGSDLYQSARRILDLHLAAGDFCIILTAAPQDLAQAVAESVGAHRAIGTRLEVRDGRFTGRIDGTFCHGPGKLARLADEVGEIDWGHTTAYGDSASDLPILERAATPIAVNPDRALRAAAIAAGWPILKFA